MEQKEKTISEYKIIYSDEQYNYLINPFIFECVEEIDDGFFIPINKVIADLYEPSFETKYKIINNNIYIIGKNIKKNIIDENKWFKYTLIQNKLNEFDILNKKIEDLNKIILSLKNENMKINYDLQTIKSNKSGKLFNLFGCK